MAARITAATPPIERFPALAAAAPWASHGLVQRVPGIPTNVDREEALARLASSHQAAVEALGFSKEQLWTAEQVHGTEVAIVPNDADERPIAGVDGLLSCEPGCLLGIYVADCCPIFLADRLNRVVALLHSGKKGTELGILPTCLTRMKEAFGSKPRDVVVQLGPCIRPPAYQVDFASDILKQAVAAGVPEVQVHDCGICTAGHVDRYYSYRVEKGKTGRLLALIGISV